MASEKPVSGPDPQPAGLISVGAGGGGGGGGGGGSSSSSVAVMGELRASGSGSVVLPAGMINPSVPIRNIRMKFAVLIGLIQVGEVSNRDIVETVLNLLVGGEFDLEMNFIIQDAESITCMSELLEHCDVTCQAEIWSMFTAILRKSVRNLQTSTEVGLIEQVLLKMSTVDDMIADLLVDMLGVLASYSITVKELKLLFSMLRGENGIWPRHAVKLLSVLNQMPQRHGPDTFFNFPGCSAAAIALPPIAKWPYQNGFTLNTWFRMDPLNNINVDKDKPYLYCFRTSKGVGYSAHFVGNCLIVTSLKSKGKGFQHCVKYDFQPRKWYMISIVHIYNRWRNSEIRCYVNGQLVSYGDMAWHVNTNDSYDKCFLGSSETADANRVFCGQLGAVYVFTEALNPAQIFAIHQLGPGYKSTFKFKSESDIHLAEHHKQVLYDGKLASSIAFTYNAKATDAQLCLESSPKENPSIFVHSPHALMLQDVKAIVTHSIHSAIHSIGGIQVLFPLFAQLDNRQLHDSQVETTVCATLLAFLVELLKSSVAMQEQMLGGKGFLVIGYLLEKSSRVHITRAVLEQFLSFAKYLDGLSHGAPLLKQLCDHILFNPAIWIHTPAKVQLSLYTYLSAEFIGTATIYNTIRRVGTVLQLMHTLKYYYWVVNPADSSGITPKGLDGPRPSQKEIVSLRAFMLLFLKQLILKDRGVKEDELQSILNYLLTMHEDENIHDVLQLLVALMSEHPASMIPAFDQRNGIRVIYKLLASKSESIWVQALKVLGYFLKHLGHKRKVEIMHTHSLFTLLGERLMLHTNTVTVTTYNTLYEILTEQVCTQVVHKPHPEPDSTVKIQNPMILKVVATLLKNSTPSAELMEVRRLFLSDMIKLFSNSRENRRCLLQCSVWQDWMFSLGYINPKNSEEQKITEMVYNIFRILLYHAIKYEWGGWRVWVDTLSIAHSKVTYEAHKEYLAKMYEEYQRQEEENIKKGKKGNVSTISGLSSQTTGAKGGMEIREIEDLSQSQSPESETDYPVNTDTRDLLMATKVSDDVLGTAERPGGGGVHVEVHDLLVDIKAEKVEATEVKLDDMDLSPETLGTGENGALVEVESLLDNVYSAAVEKLQNNVHGSVGIIKKNEEKDNGPLITLADEKDEPSTNNTSFLFDKIPSQEEKLLPELSSNHIAIPNVQETQMHLGVNDDLGLLAHMTGSVDITCASSIIEDKEFKIHTTSDGMNSISERELSSSSKGLEYAEMTATTLETESSGSKTVPNVDAGSIISDTERSDDGKEAGKEIRKIQTTTTTQAIQGRSVTQQDRDLRVDLGFRGMPMTEEQRRQFSPGPRTTMFRIPEFKWSPMHQRLLTDLLFALETDVHVWRSHSTKSVMDFVNSNENIIFVHNTIHLISQMVDNIIIACGGILPLLSAATSPTGSKTELENIEVTQGMSAETAVTFLSRLMAMVDVLVFASSLNFSEIEAEKNMSSGGLMRQCLRLVCCVAVRNCLECRQRQRERVNKTSLIGGKTQDALQGVTAAAATKTPLENVPGNLSPIKDPDRLLQDVDINRLRAVVFRDVDDSKQAQFLALAVVYFISVLMVSKYRDILEPQRETARSGSQAGRNIRQEINSPTSTVVVIPSIPHPSLNHGFLAKLIPEQSFAHSFYKDTPTVFPENIKDKETPTPVEDIQLESSIPHTDSGIGDEQMPNILNGTDLETSTGPDAMSELLSTLSSEVKKSQESLTESPSEILKPASSISSISQSKGINVKEILKSLVAAPVEIAECGPDPIPYPDPALKREAQAILPMQFHSFDRSVVVPVKKPPPGSLAVTTVGAATAGSGLPPGSTPNIFAATGATPKSMINTTGAVDSGSSSSSSSSSFVNGATSKNLPAVQTVAPMPEDSAENMSITAKLERALEKVAPLLREIFVDFAPFLSRTLLGSHGQELLIEGLVCMKSSTSVVELVMLLCSQEWQNSIQKNAGLAFIELINEGRLLCHAMKDHIVRVANEAEFILNRQRAEDVHKHAEFESQCAQYAADRREEEKMCDHLISAAKHRDHVTANQLKQKILNILTNKHGAWGAVSHSQLHDFWRLDYWEDDLRRRRRFVRNAFGSTHADALLKAAVEYGTEEDVVKSKKTFRSQAVVNQNAETELMLEGDDDAVSLLQEKEIDNLAGPVVLSTPAQLIAPVVVAKGTLSITTTEIYFEVDEDDSAFKKIDPKVLAYTEGLHGKWMFSEIRAVFSRRYLLQNTALEVFMANRTSVMFNFPDQATVKKVVYSLPRVGVGTSYGLPQARRISLATPRQLYKSSNMTQRWQRREISNFEYLMFLNTIAGRTYNDLNQYPVFPWVLTNYESEELDLTLPGNFRDLSKPIGALNPKRAVFYAERYETWEDDQTPPYHYNTHYSTSTSTLAWLVRIEPFTTFFLNANDGKFDHPDRTFSSVARSWRNSQRDTSDVKELIPEFYYLPEMFVNSNGYNLGIREDEIVVNDVDLPPWAKKPEDFVRINRMALESEFVSCQLHQWIDLIFGYKQRGPEAVRALNVFHYLTYEGSVNLDSITDPVLREAMEAQIQNFGQTPSQLLIEPHPPRSSAMHLSPLMFKDQMQQDVIMVLKFPSNSPVTHVAANTLPHLTIPAVVTVTCSRLFAVNRWHNTVGLRGAPGYSLDQAHHLPIEMDPLIANNSGVNKRQITDLVDQSIQINAHCFVVTADNRYILICGFWDKSFRVYSTETGKLTQIVFGHWDVVTCLARSESYIGGDCYIVSGSRDATLLLWYWSGRHHIIGDNPNSSDYPAPRAVLTGHDHEVVCVSVCAELGLVISGAKEGPCLVHTITGDLLRALEGTENCLYPRLISVSSEGHCIIYYERGRFSNFSINGKLLAQMEINDSTRAILLSSDGQNLVTGGDNGVVEVWQACDFKQLYIYPGCDAGIRAMDLSHDQRTLITGMASGSIVAFNIDFNRWHYEHQNRY
ncbi:neurobeachin isoform X10 [Catharus ustulatus]|uniref:neurobeachin isoform X10 n=1 Tax=Catharus ustulatus TaxID=91951 RepID=UPI00140B19BF|nr:neurobeachin isoform X10 [Catharus ustulatus]